jgi:hypothetical protein
VSTEREPGSRDLDRAVTSVIACAVIGGLGGIGEVAVLNARHLMSASNVLGSIAIGFAAPVIGLVVGVLSLAWRGRRQ